MSYRSRKKRSVYMQEEEESKCSCSLSMTTNYKRFLIMTIVSIVTTTTCAIFDQCDSMLLGENELLRKHDRWMVVYREGFCGYIALPMYSVSNFVWTFKNSIKLNQEQNCTNIMDYVTPKLETVRAVFMDRENITSTTKFLSSNFYENYRFRNVIFEKPSETKIVQRHNFALSIKDDRIVAAYSTGNGTVMVYKCTPQQNACFIDHQATLFLGKRFQNVKQILLHEDRLHAVVYQKKFNDHVICGTIIREGDLSRTVTAKEMPFTHVNTFAFFETRHGKEDVYLIIGHLANTPHPTSPTAHNCYVVSEMCTDEIRAIATIHSRLLEKSVIQFVYVPKEYRLLNEKELNRRLSKQNIQAARDYLESLMGSEPPVFYKHGFNTMQHKIEHHLREMGNGRRILHAIFLKLSIKDFCKEYSSPMNQEILLNCWRFQFAMWILVGLKMLNEKIYPSPVAPLPLSKRRTAATVITSAPRNHDSFYKKDTKNGTKRKYLCDSNYANVKR